MIHRTACLALALAAATGCYSIGGVPASRDKATFESHPHLPATITIVDTRTGEAAWSLDVPVGEKLTVRFYDGRKPRGATEKWPAMMRWELTDLDEDVGSLANEFAVPVADSRKIVYELREGEDFAGLAAPAQPQTARPAAPAPDAEAGVPELEPVRAE